MVGWVDVCGRVWVYMWIVGVWVVCPALRAHGSAARVVPSANRWTMGAQALISETERVTCWWPVAAAIHPEALVLFVGVWAL